MYHVLCWFIILFRLLSIIVTFYSKLQAVITPQLSKSDTCLYELFLSQRPGKSPPAVMFTSRETPCILRIDHMWHTCEWDHNCYICTGAGEFAHPHKQHSKILSTLQLPARNFDCYKFFFYGTAWTYSNQMSCYYCITLNLTDRGKGVSNLSVCCLQKGI